MVYEQGFHCFLKNCFITKIVGKGEKYHPTPLNFCMPHIVKGNDFNISFSVLSNPVPLYICIYCIMPVKFEIKIIMFKLNWKWASATDNGRTVHST